MEPRERSQTFRMIRVFTAAIALVMALIMATWLAEPALANTSEAATAAINNLKTQQYYKPGGTCPSGLGVGWLKYGNKSTNCEAECYAFASGVTESLFGAHPGGVTDTGYTCTSPGNFNCTGSLKNPSLDSVKSLFQKGYPGDWVQFCSGGSWGAAQHSAILESVDSGGVRIYQHGDRDHVQSTYYPWDSLYSSYLGMNSNNHRGYRGVSIYHAKSYDQKYPSGPVYPPSLTIQDGIYSIRAGANTSFAVDVDNGSMDDRANVLLWTFGDQDNQQFKFVRNTDDGSYTILNVRSGKALDVQWNGKDDGTNVWQYTANYAEAQRWFIEDAGDGLVRLRSKSSNKYLDVDSASMSDGANMQIWSGHTGWAQKFKLIPCSIAVPEGIYSIRSAKDPAYGLDVRGASMDDNANVELYLFGCGDNQLFSLTRNAEDSSYTITNVLSGKVVDVEWNGTADGTNVCQYTPKNVDNQRWYIEDGGNGSVRFRSKPSGKYLDVDSAAMVNEANIQIWTSHGGVHQRFKLVAGGNYGTVADSLQDGDYTIIPSCNTDYVLEYKNGVAANDSNIQVAPKANKDSQVFHIAKGANGYYTISPKDNSTYVFDVNGPSFEDDANITLYENHGARNQLWILRDCGDGMYSFQNVYTGKYMNLSGGIASAGANISQWVGNDGAAQKYQLLPWAEYRTKVTDFEPGDYTIGLQADAAYTLEYANGEIADETNIQVAKATESQSQVFHIDKGAGGNYMITPKEDTEYVFDLLGPTMDNGGNVALYHDLGRNNQRWTIWQCEDGSYCFQNVYSGKFLKVLGEEIAVGSNVGQWEGSDEAAQRFLLSKWAAPTGIDKPIADSFAYDGNAHSCVAEEAGYTLSGKIEATAAGDYEAEAKLNPGYTWSDGSRDDLTLSWKIEPAAITSAALSQASLAYNGDVQKPSLSAVKAGELTLGTSDYDTAYSDEGSENAGTYTVTVTGKGNFTGSATAEYKIEPAAITSAVLSQDSFAYNGEAQKPSLSAVKAGELTLAESDYDAAYSDENSKDAGTYTVTVTGKGNFAGSVTAEYTITDEGGQGSGEPADADKAAAQNAIAKINAIGDVTLESKDAIDEARAAYDSLTPEQKELVPASTLETLLNAEAAYGHALEESKDATDGKADSADAAAAKIGGKPAIQVERSITQAASDEGPSGTQFSKLQARSPKQTKSSITLSWKKVTGANGYTIYGNKCGKGNKYVKIADVKSTKYAVKKVAGKKVAKGKYYKFLVMSWRMVDGYKVTTSVSKTLHVATPGGKVGNYKKVKLSKNKLSLKKGKKAKLKAKAIAASKKLKVKQHRKIKFESSNSKIATVSSNGVVRAKSKGTCYVYAYAQSGTYAKCKVTVR